MHTGGINMNKTTLIIIIILLSFGAGFFVGRQKQPQPPEQKIIVRHDTVTKESVLIDTIIKTKIQYLPAEPDTVIDTVKLINAIDTGQILKDYLLTRIYKDTLINDSNLFFKLFAKVNRNRLIYDSVNYKVFKKWYVVENNIYTDSIKQTYLKRSGRLWLGASFNVIGNKSFTPELIYTTPTFLAVGAGYDVVNNSVNCSVLFRLQAR